MFTMGLWLTVWRATGPRIRLRHWAALGCACGLAALVRWQDGVVALVTLCEIVVWVVRGRLPPVRAALALATVGGCALAVFVPQLCMWKGVYGSWLTLPQGSDFFDFRHPQPWLTLFSTRHGVISWHPILGLALVGLVPLWRTHPRLALAALGLFAAELYVNSAASHWWADDAFGGRRFVSLVPVLAAPLVALATRLRLRAFAGLVIALILWNGLSLVQYRMRFVSMNEALTIEQMTIDRIVLPVRIAQRPLHAH